jgi:hypothetical protein
MRGPTGVMALVLAETTAGGVFFLFLTPLWNEVRRGFFYLTGAIILVTALATAGTAAAAQSPEAASDAHLAIVLSLVTAGATLAWMLLAMRNLTLASRIVGVATVPLSVAMLFAFARTGDESTMLSFFQLLAGAVFIGAVLDGLLLGHWYLTERKLPRKPILRMTWSLIGAVVLEAIAVAMGGFGAPSDTSVTQAISPILTVAGVASWIAIGMVALTGLIAVFIRITLQGDRPAAVQSATGFFYLAVITAFTAEVAAKVHFLP